MHSGLHMRRGGDRSPGHAPAFTLVELLVVVAIISILAAMLLPALGKVVRTAQDTKGINNHKQVNVAARLWASDHRGTVPSGTPDALRRAERNDRVPISAGQPVGLGSHPHWWFANGGYLQDPTLLLCPRVPNSVVFPAELWNAGQPYSAVVTHGAWGKTYTWETAIDWSQPSWDGSIGNKFAGQAPLGVVFRMVRPFLENGAPSRHAYGHWNNTSFEGPKSPRTAEALGLMEPVPDFDNDHQDLEGKAKLNHSYRRYLDRHFPYKLDGRWTGQLNPSAVVLTHCYLNFRWGITPTWNNAYHPERQWFHLESHRMGKGGRVPVSLMDGSAGLRWYLPGKNVQYHPAGYEAWDENFADWNR